MTGSPTLASDREKTPDDPGAAVPDPAGPVRLWWRRWRWPTLVALLAVTVVALGALSLPRSVDDFDPDSAAPDGTRALVRVLVEHGVQVEVVRSIAGVDPSERATLVVSQPGLVPFEELSALAAAGDLVLIEPDAVVLDELGLPVTPAGPVDDHTPEPGCDQPDAVAAGRARAGGTSYRLLDDDPSGPSATSTWLCYPPDDADQNADQGGTRAPRGALAVVERDGLRVSVIGQRDLMRNQHLAEQGNAALAVRLLGRQARLQWYVPDPLELSGQVAVDPLDLLPTWVRWVAWQLALTVVVVMIWRGRRLGALVPEPLPVVVRSAETHEGRARLYRRARARDRAAAALRTATARRLAARVQATELAPGELADRLAERIGADPGAVRHLLTGPVPADDAALVALAGDLVRLEQDVVDGDRPAGTAPHRGTREDR